MDIFNDLIDSEENTEIEIDIIDLYQFYLDEDISLFYDVKEESWYIEKDDPEIDDVFIIEELQEDTNFFGYILSVEEFNKYKETVKGSMEE